MDALNGNQESNEMFTLTAHSDPDSTNAHLNANSDSVERSHYQRTTNSQAFCYTLDSMTFT